MCKKKKDSGVSAGVVITTSPTGGLPVIVVGTLMHRVAFAHQVQTPSYMWVYVFRQGRPNNILHPRDRWWRTRFGRSSTPGLLHPALESSKDSRRSSVEEPAAEFEPPSCSSTLPRSLERILEETSDEESLCLPEGFAIGNQGAGHSCWTTAASYPASHFGERIFFLYGGSGFGIFSSCFHSWRTGSSHRQGRATRCRV